MVETETSTPAEEGRLTPIGRIGQRLKAAREAMGLTVRDISDQIRVRVALLESLEEGRRDELPADVFVRGFVKSYARAVGIEAEGLKGDLEKAFGPPVAATVQTAAGAPEPRIPAIPALKANKPHPYTVQNQLRGRIAFAAILLVIVGVIGVTQYMGPETEPVTVAAPPKPAEKKAESSGVEPLPADIAPPAAAAPEQQEEGALGEGAAASAAEPAASKTDTPPSGEKPAEAATASTTAGTDNPAAPAASATAAAAPVKPAVPVGTQASAPAPAAPVAAQAEPPKKPDEPKKELRARPPVVAGFGARSIKVKSQGESWIIIYQDKKVIYDRLMRAGEDLEYRFEGTAELTAGNPSVVEVTVDGQPAPPFRKRSSPSRIRLPAP